MAKAIFHSDFNYSSRKRNAGWSVKSGKAPQCFPSELIDAAVAAGVAVPVRAKPAARLTTAGDQPKAKG